MARSPIALARFALAELAREVRTVPATPSGALALAERARRGLALRAQDLRGLPHRWAQARALRAELAALLPWPDGEHQALLERGHLGPVADAPLVSVVMPVYGNLAMTLRCLVSLGATKEKTRFEIIVVDDASPDDVTEPALRRVPGIRYVRRPKNGGFVDTTNDGAAVARGRYLHLLNNDTVVLPGWLDRLVETFERVPEAGLVGSRLVYPSLDLQEAGGIVWRDGSATNWGNRRDPWSPSYRYLRDADYVSAASVLVDATLWREIGGLDERYRPAYYEDTDLAFAVRARGRRVLVQPASRVVHHEGGTAGTDVRVGLKKHQVLNRSRFVEKWQTTLARHGSYGETGPTELDRRSRASVLVLDQATPRPDESSGGVDAVNLLRVLRTLGLRVTFVPCAKLPGAVRIPDVRGHDGRYTEALERDGIECLHAPYEPSVRRLLRERGRDYDLVVLTRARVADRFLADVRSFCPRAKVVFNTTDLSFLREEREAKHGKSSLLALKAKDTRRRELGAVRRSDRTWVISQYEADLLAKETPGAIVRLLPLIREVPGRARPRDGRDGVVFVGGFRHRPNLDAAKFLVEEIWPHVRRLRPETTLHLVGSSTPDEIRALAGSDVVVHGHVPDLAEIYGKVRLSIAPLRFGAGLKGKVAESLGHGVPCVATSVGVEGSGLVHEREVLVADEADAIAREVVRLVTDDALWDRLSDAGLAHARAAYSMESIAKRVAAVLDELGVPHL